MKATFILILILFLTSCGKSSVEGVWFIDYKNSIDLKIQLTKKYSEEQSDKLTKEMAFGELERELAIVFIDSLIGSITIGGKKLVIAGQECTINSIGTPEGVECIDSMSKKITKMSLEPENGKLVINFGDTKYKKVVYTREKQDYKIVWADIFKKEIKESTETSKQSINPVETITTSTAENNSIKKEESSAAIKPSFDCSKKSTPSEIAICSDSNLAKLDKDNYDAFILARKVDPESTKITLMNSLEQRKRCGANKSCIADSLKYSEGEYQAIITLSGLKK